VGGSYLVSPAQLRVCASLCPQNVVFVSASTRQFLKQETRSSDGDYDNEKIDFVLTQEKKEDPV